MLCYAMDYANVAMDPHLPFPNVPSPRVFPMEYLPTFLVLIAAAEEGCIRRNMIYRIRIYWQGLYIEYILSIYLQFIVRLIVESVNRSVTEEISLRSFAIL